MTPGEHAALVLVGAVAWDRLLGEPPNALHPVVWIGSLQRALEKRAPRGPLSQLGWGALMALVGPLVFGAGAWALLRGLDAHVTLRLLVEMWLLKSAFAVRALADAAAAVERALVAGDLVAAREALRSLVSRDTSGLAPPLLAAAAIESVAENASDSIVAPLCAFAVAGVPGALAYRAVNTLDAMIGYRGALEWLGKAAARLDDLANLLPARLTAALITIAAPVGDGTVAGALAAWKRDAGKTESPNAGRPMAAMAGALSVELEKIDHYRLNAGARAPTARDLQRAVAILRVVAALAVALALAVGWARG